MASPVLDTCKQWLRPGCTVLDIGVGSGRDMAALQEAGFDVFGLEPTAALIAEAETAFPSLRSRIARGALPSCIPVADRVFSGVLCSAVLMHLPAEEWFEAVRALRKLLAPSGRIIVSVSTGRKVDPVTHRDADGRLFHEPDPAAVQALFERAGFQLLHHETAPDRLGRAEITWHTFALACAATGRAGPDLEKRVR